MRDWINLSAPPRRTMPEIAAAFCVSRRVALADLKGPSRVSALARLRQRAYVEIYSTGRYSTTQVGLFFGGRDYTTVAHGIARCAARAGLPPAIRNLTSVRKNDLGLLSLARALAQQEAV